MRRRRKQRENGRAKWRGFRSGFTENETVI